jgi:hypothetical protein
MSSSEMANDLETRNKLANASAKRTFFIMLIFQFCPANKIHGTVLVERPARSRKILEIKKPPYSGKTGNEGILRILMKTVHRAGLIFLFAEKLVEVFFDRDEHN